MDIATAQSKPSPQRLPPGLIRRLQNNFTVFFLLLPALVLFLLFVVWPIFRSVYFSTFDWNGFGPATKNIGIQNYIRILSDTIFQKAILNGLLIVVLSLVLQLPFSLGMAIMVGRDLPGRSFFRTIFFLPYVISEVIAAIMWLGLFNPDPSRGFINAIITLLPGVKAIPWLGDTHLVLACIFVVMTWKYFGFHMLLYMAGLQNIPSEIEEAARIDGANTFQLLRYITIPLLRSTIQTTVYLSVLGSLQQFILVWIMTKGGPVNASEVMATYMYRFSFVRFWLGYGSAVAIVMLLIALTISITYQRVFREQEYAGIG
jgi:raffinose/stachyose/melibiose transport system permease protein